MLQKTYLKKVGKDLLAYSSKRRDVIKISGDALHLSKRAIFAMHRDNMKEAAMKIKEAEKMFKGLNKKYSKDSRIQNEGSYKAGLEEYVEAVLLYQFLSVGKIGEIKTLPITPEGYIAGLCDVPGELYRYSIKAATDNDIATVKKCADMAAEITGELIEFNLTSYLRNKFDQAKSAVQKIERVVYELSLRK
ncbi:hypothetical protein HOF40_03155 [Candidatus Parcubacteria bacterium]|jgi:translin|nr:hypothetical protein [Candidatus Parcubacteria bacterium]MBT3949060.1 hypothetical protein [Candidatus Parcubacteria bacterium]